MPNKSIKILWNTNNVKGTIDITNEGSFDEADKNCRSMDFSTETNEAKVTVYGAKLSLGSFATILTVRSEKSFSFFLRDIRKDMPVWIPEYEIAVTDDSDNRNYIEIVKSIESAGKQTKIQMMENGPEESYESAASHNRNMPCVTWLGTSRDVRMFEVRPNTLADPGNPWDVIQPRRHFSPVSIPEMGDRELEYDYFAGRGIGCRKDVSRHLERGYLPILNMESKDDEISYEQVMFVTNEVSPLVEGKTEGTNYLIADLYAKSPTPRTEEQQIQTDKIHDTQINRTEETVFYLRVDAVNTSNHSKYAYIRIPQPNVHKIAELSNYDMSLTEDGFDIYNESGRVFMVATINGEPVRDVEYAVLLGPGEKVRYEFKIPHRPISEERARALKKCDFDEKLGECIAFWESKLSKIADIHLPEKRIEEMMKAGFLHLDLVCFGNDPDDAVAPVVGVYTPIGTESTPIIQYIESMGDTGLAKRACDYFVKKQRKDGFIQNFSNYMSETGLGLFNIASHYRYTHDKEWLKSVESNIVRGCEYIMKWSESSKDEKLRRHGYGMIDGKVGDCEYPYHSFMLNSTTYGGVKACADVLKEINSPDALRIEGFAEELKSNILETLDESFAVSPVIPLADGSWCPAIAQWPEINGPMCLFANGGKTFSHGMMMECSENGCYDILYGIIDPKSDYAAFIIKMVTEMIALENTSFSQPYYSVHPFVHLLRKERKSFLKEFYNNMSALADRETYTFWEHQYQESPHKTHEEAWFLMRCRWMLYMDTDKELKLLEGIPRRWMADGQTVAYEGVNTVFGRLSVNVKSELSSGKITARIELTERENQNPDTVTIRIPHPESLHPTAVSGGKYSVEDETVAIDMQKGYAEVTLEY